MQSLYVVLSISSSLFLMMMMMNLVSAGPTGLTLKLIHSDSPNSPLYPGRKNLTDLEIMERAYQQSIARYQHINKSSSLNAVRPRVLFDGPSYIVELGIGTFPNENPPYKKYYFIIDSGSEFLWLQCEGCQPCFNQDADLFPKTASNTYQEVHTSTENPNPLCKYGFLLRGNTCGYHYTYADGSTTLGALARERLTVSADNGRLEAFDNFFFGCGLAQEFTYLGNEDKGQNPIVGIFGLGGDEPESFLARLGARGQRKFEYCLELWIHGRPSDTFLRFGSDTKTRVGDQSVQTTGFIFPRFMVSYYVFMSGISVAGIPIEYHDQDIFGMKNDGTGGCVFDSGTPWSLVSAAVYEPLKAFLIGYFAHFGIGTRDPGTGGPYQLCFDMPKTFNILPTITFHFVNGAALEIEPAAAFYLKDTLTFCLKILKSDKSYVSVVIGAFQQANHRILYDVGERRISWSKEDCAANS